MVFFYYIIRDYYLPRRTDTIAADLLSWLLYIVHARALTLYIERGFRLLAKICYTLYLIYIERKNICPRRQSITDTDSQADAYTDS